MTLVAEKRRMLWLGAGPMPANLRAALGEDWEVRRGSGETLSRDLQRTDLALIVPAQEGRFDPRRLALLLDEVDRSGAVAVVLLPGHLEREQMFSRRRGQFVFLDEDASAGELAAGIKTAAALQPAIRHLRTEVAAVRGLGAVDQRSLQQLDEEMRLAARLQRDFLPKQLPAVCPVRFAALFRPAGWVSGDIYDVFRLDEDHVGFYVADAVGHGMPAALLTMFIKEALQTKRIRGHTYEILAPDVALWQLNAEMCRQDLSSCQFCSAVYAIVDARSLRLRLARGGHPLPVLLRGDGSVRRLEAPGPLLGVFPDAKFHSAEVALADGDRVVVFSDGADEKLLSPERSGSAGLLSELLRLRHLPAEEMVLQLAECFDRLPPGIGHEDDITVLVMDVCARADGKTGAQDASAPAGLPEA